MRVESVVREIRCNFSPDEAAEIAKQLVQKLTDQTALEEEKKSANSAFKGRQDLLEEDISALARKYSKGYEMREVSCDIRYHDPEPGKKSIYRVDTGEQLETKEMTDEEKQEILQFNIPEPTDEAITDALNSMSTEPPPEEDEKEKGESAGA